MRLLIDKAELMRHIENEMREWGEEYDALQILGDIEDFPTIDPVKHGEWIKVYENNYQCSECGDWLTAHGEDIKTLHYCTNCGTKMDEEEE